MINLVISYIVLILLLILSLYLAKGQYMSPSILYIGGFVIAMTGAVVYADEWKMRFHFETGFVLISSCFIFLFVSVFVRYYNDHSETIRGFAEYHEKQLSTSFIVLCGLVLMHVLLIAYQYHFIMGYSGGAASLGVAISNFRFRDNTGYNYPALIKLFIGVSQATGYYLVYMLSHSMVYKYRLRHLLLVLGNLALCFLSIFMSGSRGNAIAIFIAALIQFFILYGRKSAWRNQLDMKHIIPIILLVVLLIVSFQEIGNYMGRENDLFSPGEYLAIYFSGSIFNLNKFVGSHIFGSSISKNETFLRLVNNIAVIIHKPSLFHETAFDFTYSNNHFIGNVYTILAAFLHDWGYWGLFGLTTLMALLSQYSFNRAAFSMNKTGYSFNIILYSYIGTTVFMSFFSARFYLDVFNKNFVQMIIYWIIFEFLITRIKIGDGYRLKS